MAEAAPVAGMVIMYMPFLISLFPNIWHPPGLQGTDGRCNYGGCGDDTVEAGSYNSYTKLR